MAAVRKEAEVQRSYAGADPFALTRFELAPGRVALVVIDMQNDFLHESGWYARQGIDIAHMRAAITPTAALVAEARAHGVPVIWTRHGFRDLRDAGILARHRPFFAEGGLRPGSWGYEVLEECGARPDDWFVEKQRLSAFFATNLELVLRALRAETVLFCGVLTNQCVAATSKDASFRDFQPIVVREATGTTLPHLHDPALEMMAVGWAEVRSLADTVAALRALPLVNEPAGGLA
ncbi:cysteine hydrolase family protein [Crenalkalicoccus roseus]|uniref:cysteine hydrolase family protein n=1 Tax=Crenalkalicoccus roseus TaxID=1485588 RepID=UPI001305140A|nr:isochorismatase family cysteine hydrolase [Crenalkalicoccus roseus]